MSRLYRWWPGGLVGRSVVVLLAAVILVHLGTTIVYRDSAFYAASTAQTGHLAERLATAYRTILRQAPVNRDETAHTLSSVDLSLQWSDHTAVAAMPIAEPDLVRLRDRVDALLPSLGKGGIRLGYVDRPPPGDAHDLLGSLQLPDGSFVGFRVPILAAAAPALDEVVVSTSLMASVVALVAILLMRSIGLPLRGLAGAADAMGAGPSVAVEEAGPDEVRQVAKAFNRMQARMHRLVSARTQALAAVSHDLRTPITRLRLRAGFMTDPELQEAVDSDLDEMQAMIDATLAYLSGDADPEAPKSTNLASMLATLVDDATDAGRRATFDGPRQCVLSLRGLQVKRAFANLLDNALTYGSDAHVELRETPQFVRVTIEDHGPGIPPGDLERMFEPFQRLDPSRNRRTGGVGLGLAIVRQTMDKENAAVVVTNRQAGGLRVEVIFTRQISAIGPAGRNAFASPMVTER